MAVVWFMMTDTNIYTSRLQCKQCSWDALSLSLDGSASLFAVLNEKESDF